MAVAALAAAAFVQLGAAAAASASTSPGAGDRINPVDAQRAVATYQAMQDNLYIPQYDLYKKSDPTQNFGYLWDFVNPFSATDYMAAIPGIGDRYRSDLQARDRGVMYYHNTQETSPTGQAQPAAFASGVRPPLDSNQPTYYDDNAWVGLDFMQEYGLTHQRSDLTRAEGIFRFVVSGWDTRTTVACPGGVFWEDVANSTRNTISNAPNAEVGLQIYQATHDPYYLTWATRMYDWVRGCLMNSSGMYYDHLDDSGNVNTALWSYNQGTMIGAGTLLYQVTGNRTYLQQAEQTATASVSYYGSGDNLYHQPDVFDVIFFRNLFALAKINHDPSYAQMAAAYADTAWLQDRQSSGLFTDPDPTGGESLENQTSPMVELYAMLAQSRPVFAATGSASPSSVIVQPGQVGTTNLSLQSVTGSRQTVKWTASAPSGFSVSPSSGTLTLPGDGTASTPVSITGGATDGSYQVTFKFTSASGTIQSTSASVIVATPRGPGAVLQQHWSLRRHQSGGRKPGRPRLQLLRAGPHRRRARSRRQHHQRWSAVRLAQCRRRPAGQPRRGRPGDQRAAGRRRHRVGCHGIGHQRPLQWNADDHLHRRQHPGREPWAQRLDGRKPDVRQRRGRVDALPKQRGRKLAATRNQGLHHQHPPRGGEDGGFGDLA